MKANLTLKILKEKNVFVKYKIQIQKLFEFICILIELYIVDNNRY
jgi:hypothetical protein